MPTREPSLRPARRTDDGAAAVEFALVSVILFPLLLGIIGYGLYFYQSSAVSYAAREGARAASLGITSCDDWRQQTAAAGNLRTDDDERAPEIRLTFDAAESVIVGAPLTVSIRWERPTIGLPVDFLPGDPMQTTTATARVEYLGDLEETLACVAP